MEEEQLNNLKDQLWRNYPASASTFGKCPKCDGSGRGGNLCADCVAIDLGNLVGDQLAVQYHFLIKEIRRVEGLMEKSALNKE